MNIDQHIAQGTNLIFFIPTCITAIIINKKRKNINYKIAIYVICAGLIGAIIGAKISMVISIFFLKKIFGLFLLIIALYEIYTLKIEYINNKKTNTK